MEVLLEGRRQQDHNRKERNKDYAYSREKAEALPCGHDAEPPRKVPVSTMAKFPTVFLQPQVLLGSDPISL